MLRYWFAGVIALVVLVDFAQAAPNILLIVSDDQGWPDLGTMGLKDLDTPALDRLASSGVRATQFYVTWPACTPSRSSLITGRYPQRNGLYDMVRNDMVNYGHRFTEEEYAVSPEMTLGLDPREETFGNLLQRTGYRTGMVGKWDMGQAKRYLPLQRGFDYFYGHGNNGIDYYTHERYGVPSLFDGNERTEKDKGTYATTLFKDKAIHFINSTPVNQPWFLYLCFNAPHGASAYSESSDKNGKSREGVQAPQEFVDPYRKRGLTEPLAKYYGAVTCMDAAIGEIEENLRERREVENTLILFLSDNGGSGNGGNAPLRGKKGDLWEGGLRVPFIACWPAKLPEGKIIDDFLTSLEIFPTILSASNGKLSDGIKLDGFDCLPVLRGEKPSPRKQMFWQRRSDRAARVDNWKWVDMGKSSGLFDLAEDPNETKDLSSSDPKTLARIKSQWEAWRREMDATEPRGPFRDY
jgi:arylsulfatase A-like enzyme